MNEMWSHPWIAALVAAAVRGAPLLLLAGLATFGWRRSSAATRHLLWLVAIAAMLVLPVLSASLPAWRVTVLPASVVEIPAPGVPVITRQTVVPPTPAVTIDEPAVAPMESVLPMETLAMEETTAPRDWGRLAFLFWCIGAALVAFPMVIGRVRVWMLARTGRPPAGGPWGALASTLPGSLGLAGRVRVLESDRASMPMAFGIVKPTVLLPADASHWPFERRRDVLLHELAHVGRRDCLTQLISQSACALYWFDPLVWVAARALRGERERACDDAVVRAGARPSEYATHLLQVARDLRVPRAASLATVCMARRSQLSDRLLAILDERRSRRSVSRRFAVPAWVVATLVVIPASAFVPARDLGIAPIIVSAIVPSEGIVTGGVDVIQPSVRATLPPRIFTAHDLLGEPTQCDYSKKGNTSISRNADDDRETSRVHISAGDCDLTVRVNGKVRYANDLSDVLSISPGGSIVITESDAITTRRVDIRSDGSGRLARKFTVDGVERPWDDEGRRWLASVLVALERRTAFNAETRVPQLYERGGVEAVLREASQLSGDHARRRYFTTLFKMTPSLSESETRRALEIAGNMDSDFEIAETLIAIAKTGKIGAGSSAYLAAVRNIESDFETRRVLTALLKTATPDAAAMELLLRLANNIESDFELAELLISVSKRSLESNDARDAYFKALETIESDFERRRVLMSILRHADKPESVQGQLLQAASTIDSDFELAEFLVAFARKYPDMSSSTHEVFMKAADSIESQHEYGRVMQSYRGKARRTSGMF